MAKVRKALVGAVGAGLAVIAQALTNGSDPDWKPVLALALGAAVTAFAAVWGVPNKPA